jgi:hypothetical protein
MLFRWSAIPPFRELFDCPSYFNDRVWKKASKLADAVKLLRKGGRENAAADGRQYKLEQKLNTSQSRLT